MCIFIMLYCLFLEAFGSTAEKELTYLLPCVLCFLCYCHFPIWYSGKNIVLDCIISDLLPMDFLGRFFIYSVFFIL